MIEIRWLKEYKDYKIGDIGNAGEKSAENFVSQGYAEYVEKPKNLLDKLIQEAKEDHFSFYENGIRNVIPSKDITLTKFIEVLKSKDYEDLILEIRKEPDKDKRNILKANLPYVTFGGSFKKRAKKYLIKSSGYACFDEDDVEDIESVKKELLKNKYTHLVFVSPSGKGLKLIVKIPKVEDDEEYKKYWLSIEEHYNLPSNDEATKDISRACYLSIDKNPFINLESNVYTEKVENIEKHNAVKNSKTDDKTRSAKEYGKVIQLIKKGFDKQKVFDEMQIYSKWASSPEAYKDFTYKKALSVVEGEKEESKKDDFLLEDFLIITYKDNGDVKEKKVNIDKVAHHLKEKHNIKTIFGKKNDYVWNYDNGIYKQEGRGIIKTDCEKILLNFSKRSVVDEIFEKIKRLTKTDKEEFEKTDTNLIPLRNGVWDIKDKKLLEYRPEFNFKFIIDIEKKEIAKCPNWDKFISEALYPADIPIAQEWKGFNLIREYFIKKGLICVGDQDTGKSVYLDTLIKFIGEKNKTGISLQKITSGSDFTKLSLKDKHSNIYDDLSSKDLSDGGAFKIATGGGYISGEEKFGEFSQFRSFAKQTFATNKIPPVKDNDDLAYFGRWIVLKFDNVPEKIDPFLRKKLWTDKEMSGILNWALEGLYRLLENGCFSYNKTSAETKRIMEESGCPLILFSNQVLENEDGNIITKDEMYKVYSSWALDSKKPRLSKEQLGRQLTKYCPYILAERHKERIWKNAKINKKIIENYDLHTTTDTSDTFKNTIRTFQKESKNNDIEMVDMLKKEASVVSLKNTKKEAEWGSKEWNKKQKKGVIPVNERTIQFNDPNNKQTQNIKPICTKEEVFEYITQTPDYDYKVLIDTFGVGCLKFRNELLREGKINEVSKGEQEELMKEQMELLK